MVARFDPPRPARTLDRELDLLRGSLDDFFGDLVRTPAAARDGSFQPTADIVETDDDYRILVELPGVQQDDFKLSFTDNVLTLSAEKKSQYEEEKDNVWRMERSYGSFSRQFSFRQPVDPATVAARYRDGVLEITLPKAEEAKPRTIDVKVR